MPDSEKIASKNHSELLIDWQCFSYLTAEKGKQYRAMIHAFASAKAEFTLHLRPAEIRDAIANHEVVLSSTETESALQQLESWGNLQSYQDNSDVASLADYYQKRLLYQLTAAGEAAHAATLTFELQIKQQAKLDARALERIADGAGQLERLAQAIHSDPDRIDTAVVLTAVRSICQDADELTSRAQSFFRWLHEQTESDRGNLEAFLIYKERLIDYLQQFVSELITSGSKIAQRLNSIADPEFLLLAQFTADEEVGAPRAGEEAHHETRLDDAKRRWHHRLLALRGWFSRSGGHSSQLEQLRAAARAAIPRLLQLAGQMSERQSGRSDRVADLRMLATQFLSCRDDAQAHQLYRAAFALSPARHLRIDQSTIEFRDQNLVAATTRWLDAEPVEFAPQLRKTGRQPVAAANRRVVDRSNQRAAAQRRLSTESGQSDSSRETLIALGRRKLSEIGELDHGAFRLMMELIELATPRPPNSPTHNLTPDQTPSGLRPQTTISRDGSIQMKTEAIQYPLDPEPEGIRIAPSPANHATPDHNSLASLRNPSGHVLLHDIWIEVSRVN